MQPKHPYVYHLVQAAQWDRASAENITYFPPTYDQDGFTHGTSNPDKLLSVANHFYLNVTGDWYCLKMTVESLKMTGVMTVYEGTAPVGSIPADFDGAHDELFPHIYGGITAAAVIGCYPVKRLPEGTFVDITGITNAS